MAESKRIKGRQEVPIWEKFALTINESTIYFNIGEKKIRKLIDDNMDYGFMIHNGAKMLINRRKFEDFLNETTSI